MPDPYRLTIFEVDGQIDRMLPFEARDCEMALAFAERQRYGRPAELWSREGLVQRFPCAIPPPEAHRLRRAIR